MKEVLNHVRRIIRASAMDSGSIRNTGVIFNATHADMDSALSRQKEIHAISMDGGSAEFRRKKSVRPPWMAEVLEMSV